MTEHTPRETAADYLARHRVPVAPVERHEFFGLDPVLDVIDGVVERLAHGQLGGDRGLLFTGDPGTGKTMSARYLATRLAARTGGEVPFYALNLDDLTPLRIRESIAYLDAQEGVSIIYLDEVDGFARKPPQDQQETAEGRALRLAFQSALDGVIDLPRRTLLIASTNIEPRSLFEPLLRAGRLGRTLRFDLPSEQAAGEMIVSLLAAHSDLSPDELSLFGRIGTRALSGADLRQIADDAIARATAANRRVLYEDLATALTARGINRANADANIVDPRVSGLFLVHEVGHAIAISSICGVEKVRAIALFDSNGGHVMPQITFMSTEMEELQGMIVGRAGALAELIIDGSVGMGSKIDMERYDQIFQRLFQNGRWPSLTVLRRTPGWEVLTTSSSVNEELLAIRRALDAWTEENARAAILANQHLFTPIVAALKGRVGVDAAGWAALLAEHGPIVPIALTPLPALVRRSGEERAA